MGIEFSMTGRATGGLPPPPSRMAPMDSSFITAAPTLIDMQSSFYKNRQNHLVISERYLTKVMQVNESGNFFISLSDLQDKNSLIHNIVRTEKKTNHKVAI